MKLDGQQTLQLSPAETWRRLSDPQALRACTPGLEKLEARDGSDHYDAVLEVKLPAMTGRFEGTIDYLERTPPERLRLRLKGKGPLGFVDGEVAMSIAAAPPGSQVQYTADVQIGGQVARLGQRMISGVTREMAGQFFRALEQWQPQAPEQKTALPPARSALQLIWLTFLRLVGLRKD